MTRNAQENSIQVSLFIRKKCRNDRSSIKMPRPFRKVHIAFETKPKWNINKFLYKQGPKDERKIDPIDKWHGVAPRHKRLLREDGKPKIKIEKSKTRPPEFVPEAAGRDKKHDRIQKQKWMESGANFTKETSEQKTSIDITIGFTYN